MLTFFFLFYKIIDNIISVFFKRCHGSIYNIIVWVICIIFIKNLYISEIIKEKILLIY